MRQSVIIKRVANLEKCKEQLEQLITTGKKIVSFQVLDAEKVGLATVNSYDLVIVVEE